MTKITFNKDKSEFLIEFTNYINFPYSKDLDNLVNYINSNKGISIKLLIEEYLKYYQLKFSNTNYIIIGRFFNFLKNYKFKYYTKKDIIYNINSNPYNISSLFTIENRWDNWNYEINQSINLFEVIDIDKVSITNKLDLAIYLYLLKHL